MATQLKVQISAFLKGFHSIINPQWMAIFNPEEFQRVISGDDSDLDVDNLRFVYYCMELCIKSIYHYLIFPSIAKSNNQFDDLYCVVHCTNVCSHSS